MSDQSTPAEEPEIDPTQSDIQKQDVNEPVKIKIHQEVHQATNMRPRLKFWLIMSCNFLSLFIVALDRTIFTTAIIRITDDFNSLGDIGWYGSTYMLTSATSQLVFGRIYKFYNMKWVFLTSMVVFEIGSAVCGAAPSSNAFIAGRDIAGFASAGIFSGCMLIIIPLVPLHKRPMFQATFAAVLGLLLLWGR
jgi:MFS family permease